MITAKTNRETLKAPGITEIKKIIHTIARGINAGILGDPAVTVNGAASIENTVSITVLNVTLCEYTDKKSGYTISGTVTTRTGTKKTNTETSSVHKNELSLTGGTIQSIRCNYAVDFDNTPSGTIIANGYLFRFADIAREPLVFKQAQC